MGIGETLVRTFHLSKTWECNKEIERGIELSQKRFVQKQVAYKFHPNQSFVSYRNKVFNINNLGYRDNAIDTSHYKKRIAFIGDSVFEGVGVSVDDRLMTLIEAQLDVDTYDCLNFAIEGHSTLDQLEVLKQDVLNLKPSMIIWQLGFNDLDRNLKLTKNLAISYHIINQVNQKGFLQKHSALYLYLAEFKNYLNLQSGGLNNILEDVLKERPEAWAVTKTAIDDFVIICKENKIDLKVVYLPYEVECITSNEEQAYFIQNQFYSYFKTKQVVTFDLLKTLREKAGEDLFYDHVHLNEKGNRVVADELYQAVFFPFQ